MTSWLIIQGDYPLSSQKIREETTCVLNSLGLKLVTIIIYGDLNKNDPETHREWYYYRYGLVEERKDATAWMDFEVSEAQARPSG